MTFKELKLDETLIEGLDSMGFTKPTPIQEKAIPVILEGKDLIACAQTGTGKTAAFLLPTIHLIMNEKDESSSIKTLIIVPTRELALQIDRSLEGLSYFTNISSCSIYGGGDGAGFDQQKKALVSGTDFIVATPGKLLSHLNLGYVKVDHLKHLILDEADRMLDMGFYEDLMRIVNFLPAKRQNLMFSATMPKKIRDLAKNILNNPNEINISLSKPAAGVLQAAYMVFDNQKIALLKNLLINKDITGVIIFSSTKKSVKEIARALGKTKLVVSEIHSDLTQDEREEVMQDFRNKKLDILVATDIVARGIDVQGLQLVINYDVPDDAEDYVHRVGRTARADNTGMAITFINDKEQRKFANIEQLIDSSIIKQNVPVELGESPVYDPKKFVANNRGAFKNKGRKKSGNFRKKK